MMKNLMRCKFVGTVGRQIHVLMGLSFILFQNVEYYNSQQQMKTIWYQISLIIAIGHMDRRPQEIRIDYH